MRIKEFTVFVSLSEDASAVLNPVIQGMKAGIVYGYEVKHLYYQTFGSEGPENYGMEITVKYYDDPKLNKIIAAHVLFGGNLDAVKGYHLT